MPAKWWILLNQALNSEDTLDAISKEAVDQCDLDMREALAILQLLVMEKNPAALAGAWSPLLEKIAASEEISNSVADFLLSPFSKKDLQEEIRNLLCAYTAHLTPSTLWFLRQTVFMQAKAQQLMRLKVTFVVHDRFESDPCKLINFAATLKSPTDLMDTFLKAVIRTKSPLSYKAMKTRYLESLKEITSDAKLAQVDGQHLPLWSKILFGSNPIDPGLTFDEYWDQLKRANPGVTEELVDVAEVTDSFFHQARPRAYPNQWAILALVAELIKRDKRTLTYVCWPCGLGKTSCMVELAHMLALNSLPAKGKKTVTVRLVVANSDLVTHY